MSRPVLGDAVVDALLDGILEADSHWDMPEPCCVVADRGDGRGWRTVCHVPSEQAIALRLKHLCEATVEALALSDGLDGELLSTGFDEDRRALRALFATFNDVTADADTRTAAHREIGTYVDCLVAFFGTDDIPSLIGDRHHTKEDADE